MPKPPNPWPWTKGIVSHIEQGGPHRVPFVLGREHSLRDVLPRLQARHLDNNSTTTAQQVESTALESIRLRRSNRQHRQLRVIEGCEINPSNPPTSGKSKIHQAAHTDPTMAKMNCTKSVKITARKPSQHTINQRNTACDQQGQPTRPSEQNASKFDGGKTDRGHHQNIKHQAQIQCSKPRRNAADLPPYLNS